MLGADGGRLVTAGQHPFESPHKHIWVLRPRNGELATNDERRDGTHALRNTMRNLAANFTRALIGCEQFAHLLFVHARFRGQCRKSGVIAHISGFGEVRP